MRHPYPFLIKFSRQLHLSRPLTLLAWDICIDSYRTLTPLKFSPHILALAAIELAKRLTGGTCDEEEEGGSIPWEQWESKEEEIWAVMKELLELWTHYRGHGVTTVGERFTQERYIEVRIGINRDEEAGSSDPRANGGDGTKQSNGVVGGKKDPQNGISLLAPGVNGLSEKDKIAIGESVRFMLDGERERKERRGYVSGASAGACRGAGVEIEA